MDEIAQNGASREPVYALHNGCPLTNGTDFLLLIGAAETYTKVQVSLSAGGHRSCGPRKKPQTMSAAFPMHSAFYAMSGLETATPRCTDTEQAKAEKAQGARFRDADRPLVV